MKRKKTKSNIIVRKPVITLLKNADIDIKCKYYESCRKSLPNMRDNQSFSCHLCPSYGKFQEALKYVENIQQDDDYTDRAYGKIGNGNKWALKRDT